jgi:hypothetical protein
MHESPITLTHAMSKSITTLPAARFLAVLSVALASGGTVLAQSAQTAEAPATPVPAESPADKPSARIERITHEDELSRVDELRVGGQTLSIEVTPKNGAPAYEIAPAPGGADLSDSPASQGNTGRSRWRILNF